MIRRYLLLFTFVLVLAPALRAEHTRSSVQGRHFFLPSRTLFFFRPDLYVRLHMSSYRPTSHRARRIGAHSPPVREHSVYRLAPFGFRPSEMIRANTSDLIFQVNPSKALVYVDGRLIGSARDFATEKNRYPIVDGQHVLRIEFPGYQPFETQMEVVANRTLNLSVELEPADP